MDRKLPLATNDTTVPGESGHRPPPPPARSALVPAFVIVWSDAEPWRIGEIAFLDDETYVIGRGTEETDRPRAVFGCQRPRRFAPTGPLAGATFSRRQLLLTRSGRGLEIENTGKRILYVNGAQTDGTLLAPGDTIELRGHYVFLYVLRSRDIALSAYRVETRFGEPDAHGIVGESAATWTLREQIAFAARAPGHALLHGESGTGKELVAGALHALSDRAHRPLVTRNAATLPSGLVDAELFGNIRNYPNPGMPERAGIIGEANGGTLLLDEIGELPVEAQAHLLRALDERGEYSRLGDPKPLRADVRVIAATNRDPASLKHDLLARLLLRVAVPSLDARREDIPLLVGNIVQRAAVARPEIAKRFLRHNHDGRDDVNVDASVIVALLRRAYTANVRELTRLVWSMMAASPGDCLGIIDELRSQRELPPGEPALPTVGEEPDNENVHDLLDSMVLTVKKVRAALVRNGWHIQKTADELRVSRWTLQRFIKRHGIRPE